MSSRVHYKRTNVNKSYVVSSRQRLHGRLKIKIAMTKTEVAHTSQRRVESLYSEAGDLFTLQEKQIILTSYIDECSGNSCTETLVKTFVLT